MRVVLSTSGAATGADSGSRARGRHRGGGGGGKRKKKTGGGSGSGKMTAAELVAALEADPAALARLTQDVASVLLSTGFTEEIIAAVEQVVLSSQAQGPGVLLAGTVSTLTGAIQSPYAMVFLSGAATAVSCYMPPHLSATVTTGAEVWVEPVNGRMDDLMIVAVRA